MAAGRQTVGAGGAAPMPGTSHTRPGAAGPSSQVRDGGALDARAVDSLIQLACLAVRGAPSSAEQEAVTLMARPGMRPGVVAVEMERIAVGAVHAAVRRGWSPSDLAEAVRRQHGERLIPLLAHVLEKEGRAHPVQLVSATWSDDLHRLGRPGRAAFDLVGGLAEGLRLDAVVRWLPAITPLMAPPGVADTAGSGTPDNPVLRKVRALLAKAESTEHPAEAETFSAKAQELISRHALERLVAEPGAAHGPAIVARRLWISAPYVAAKGRLVGGIARANRCRSVLSERIGFSTVVGDSRDLDAVELLTASPLLQAEAAVRWHGAQRDLLGASETTSFRRSFFVSYAFSIRDRLEKADTEAVATSGHAAELVPVLARHTGRVDEKLRELFPTTVPLRVGAIHPGGWAAGRAAADMARLDVNTPLPAGG